MKERELSSVKISIDINFAIRDDTSNGKNMIAFLEEVKDLITLYCDKESNEEDSVRLFAKDILERTSQSVLVKRSMLYDAYKKCCAQNDLKEYSPHIFYQMMKDLGYRELRRSNGRFFVGIKIRQR